jgi:hypothetical protein
MEDDERRATRGDAEEIPNRIASVAVLDASLALRGSAAWRAARNPGQSRSSRLRQRLRAPEGLLAGAREAERSGRDGT